MDLNSVMDFDHVIRITDDGTVDNTVHGIYAPELLMFTQDDDCHSILAEDEKDYIAQAESQGWELLSGWTRQYSYHGVIMHQSEYVGGALADYIMETPGLYVTLTVETDDDSENSAGWVIAYRDEN